MSFQRKTTLTCTAGEIRARLRISGDLPDGLIDLIDDALHTVNHLLVDFSASVQDRINALHGMDHASEESEINPAAQSTLNIGETWYEYRLTFIGNALNARQKKMIKEELLELISACAITDLASAHTEAVMASALKQYFTVSGEDLPSLLINVFGGGKPTQDYEPAVS